MQVEVREGKPYVMDRAQYAAMFGPTTGDKVGMRHDGGHAS